MKRLLRARAVQSALAWMIWGYGVLLTATVRWRYENRAGGDAALASAEGVIALFWHSRISQIMACRPMLGAKPRRVMISLSRDGEFIALAAERLGIPAIRGSSGRGGRALSKGGAAAFRQAVTFLREGGGLVLITPDGPKGPREVLPMGPVQLARAAGRPVFLMGLAARPALAFASWDQARVPLPFSRACLVLEGPLHVAADGDEAAMEAARADWQGRMRAAQASAEALLRGMSD